MLYLWKYNTFCKELFAKKLEDATVRNQSVAMNKSYINALKKENNKKETQPGNLIVVQCYAGKSMACMKVLIDSGNQLSTISESALQRVTENKNIQQTNIQIKLHKVLISQLKEKSI